MKNLPLYKGETRHARLAPVHHSFRYPYIFLVLNLAELENFEGSFWCGHNRRSILSIWDRDYLSGQGSIKSRAERLLKDNGATPPTKIRLLTVPKLFGYVFNPVSFYLCSDEDGRLTSVIAEVNNTFGESHSYVLSAPIKQDEWYRFKFPKEFYVSPFFSVDGHYELKFREKSDEIEIQVNLESESGGQFFSSVRGRANYCTEMGLAFSALRHLLTIWLTTPRIHFQAAKLCFQRKVLPKSKPAPKSASRACPVSSFWIRLREHLVKRLHDRTEENIL